LGVGGEPAPFSYGPRATGCEQPNAGVCSQLEARSSQPAWYTILGRMVCRVLVALVLFLGPGAGCFAVESGYLTLTIVRAEIKTRDRIVYYVVNTPIYHEDPYFEVVVRAAGTVVVGEREPRNSREMLPEGWKPGAVVQGRVDRRYLFLRRPNGTEVRFIITRRSKTPPELH
jgi:hypothetical protein